MKIKRFGQDIESPSKNQWYELESGERVKCDEKTIAYLWFEWAGVLDPDKKKTTNAKETVFNFGGTIELPET